MIPRSTVKDVNYRVRNYKGESMSHINRLFVLALLVGVLMFPAAYADVVNIAGVQTEVQTGTAVPATAHDHAAPIVTELDEVLVDFDDLDAPGLFSQAEALTTEYTDQGVTFEGMGEVLHEDSNFGVTGHSYPNFLAFNTGAAVPGPETMIFEPPISSLSLIAGSTNAGTITLDAYDASGNLVDSNSITGNDALATMTVESGEIVTAVISFTGTWLVVDDLLFEQDLTPDPVEFDLYPTTVVIPPNGGSVVYDAQLVSNIPGTYTGLRYTTYVTLPNNQVFGPLMNIPVTITPFMNTFVIGLTQNIPSDAPVGTYSFRGRVGYPAGQFLDDTFEFEKIGAAADGVDNWDASDFFITDNSSSDLSVPSEFTLEAAYPNPFNAATTVSVTLPEAADLSVTVYNVAGQMVATLANDRYNSGSHSLTFDASNLSSGLYFVRATVSGQLNATQKVMLVR
jgi:Secretion system C-terminal sorting domain